LKHHTPRWSSKTKVMRKEVTNITKLLALNEAFTICMG
jgi:hypothetical protein